MRDFITVIGRIKRGNCFALLAFLILSVSATPQDKKTQTIVIRAKPSDAKVSASEVEVKIAGNRVHALTVLDPATIPSNIAFVIDAGPDQTAVLNREKELAVSMLNAISVPANRLLVVRAGYQHTVHPTTSDKAEAIRLIEALATEQGKKSEIPIYDAMASAVDELARLPGTRILIVIAEGNDYGSSIGYKKLRDLVQAHHVTCFIALVDRHPTRGTKAILRYGWSLQDLANDTAGAFVENSKKLARTATRLSQLATSLRLVTFEIATLPPPLSCFCFLDFGIASAFTKVARRWHKRA